MLRKSSSHLLKQVALRFVVIKLVIDGWRLYTCFTEKMKKLVLIPLVLTIAVVAFVIWIFINVQPVNYIKLIYKFNVPKGATVTQIGNSLYEQKLIRNVFVFKTYIQLSGLSNSIQFGDYQLSPSMDMFRIVKVLTNPAPLLKVTIPEGFTYSEIAAKFAKGLNKDKAFENEFIKNAKDDEGYLFPDTYLVGGDATPGAIIKEMKAEFEKKTGNLKPTRDQVILASIIERETKGEEERPIVSGILMNRLKIGMALQVDVAPVTYQKTGLPDAPIANPGLVSIKAAINPEITEYLYYLHDPTGQIHYARSLEAHNANIKKYLW